MSLIYNNSDSLKATAVTVTANYSSTSLKASDYGSAVVTINAAARTKALSVEGNAKANKIIGTSANDTLNGAAGNDTLTGGDGADIFIYDGKGSDVITDYTAGEDTLKLTGTVGSYSISGSDATFKVSSGTVKISGGKNKAVTVVDSKNATKTYDGGLIYDGTVAKAKAVTVSDSYGNTLASYGASVVTIDSSARSKALNITGNAAANKIVGTAGNDTIDGGGGNDTLTGGKGKDIFVYETGGGNDIITDYTAGQDTIKISEGAISNYSISGSDAIFKIDSGSLKVTGGKTSAIIVVDANKNISTYQNGAIYNNATPSKATAITLTSGYSASSITAGSTVVTVDASPRTAAIKITGNAKNNLLTGGTGKDFLDGGKGADTLAGGKGNDTLTGGEGKDVFVYADGDGGDLITDYVSGEDIIKLTSGAVKDYSVKNGDAMLKIGSGTITLKGAGTSAISVRDADDVLKTYGNGLIYNATKVSRSTVVTITSGYSDEEFGNYGASVETIDASGRTKALNIIGNTGANYILGTKGKDTIDGGKGDDILIGGKGNDILTGGRGDDIFYFDGADGNDTITDYSTGDIISVSASVSYSTVGSNAILKIGTGNVTLQNAAGAAVTIVGADKVASVYGNGAVTTETYIGKVTIPSDALQYNGHSYYIFDTAATWDEAKSYAEELGGHLVTITDSAEQSAIKNLLAAHSNAKNSYWLGGYRDDDLGWQWITGENWSYTSWGGGQPDGDLKNGVLCNALMMYYSNANDWLLGDWNDFHADGVNGQDFFGTENFGYIVEWETVNSSASGNDTVYVTLPAETVTVGGGDTVTVTETVEVEVTLPAETVTVGGDTVTITVGGGGGGSIVTGTSGNDTLFGSSGDDTFTGGAGNDIFVYGGGFDIITDYGTGADTISIGANAISGGMAVGNDVLMAIGGGVIKILGAKNKAVSIAGSSGASVYSNGVFVSESISPNGVTVTLDASLPSWSEFKLETYNETANVKAVNVDGSALRNPIYLDADDNANIIWAGKNGGSICAFEGDDTIFCGDGNDVFYYTKYGGSDVIYNFQTGDKIHFSTNEYEARFKNISFSGNDIIINLESGDTVTLKDAKDQRIYLTSYYEDHDGTGWHIIDNTVGKVTISGGSATLDSEYLGYFDWLNYADSIKNIDASAVKKRVNLYGNDSANVIRAGREGGSIFGGEGNDTIYCDNGDDSIYYDKFGGSDIIYNYRTGDRIIFGSSDATWQNLSLSGNDVIINLNSGDKITLKDAKEQKIYLSENGRTWNSTYGKVTISGDTLTLASDYIGGVGVSDYAASIKNIDASAVRTGVDLYGDDSANVIRAGREGGSILGGEGNDTIYCGRGTDNIRYDAYGGSDVIYNFQTGDKIHFSTNEYEAQFKNISFSGNDVIINLDSGDTVTLKDAKNQQIHIDGYYTDYNGTYVHTINNTVGKVTISGGSATLASDYAGDYFDVSNYAASIKTVDASAVKEQINLYGDDSANVILAGRAGGEIYAGKGNDTIYCGRAEDQIYHEQSSGNDVIYDIGANDNIKLRNCSAENVSVKGSDVIITTNYDDTITVKNASSVNFKINSRSWQEYTSNGNAAVPWFAEDDTNFTTGADLDELIDSPIANSAGALSVGGGDSLNAFDFALAYTDDK